MNRKLVQKRRKSAGQAIVEYIIIVAIVAIGALTVIGLFGDRIKEMFAGATSELGSDEASSAIDKGSKEQLQDLTADGLE